MRDVIAVLAGLIGVFLLGRGGLIWLWQTLAGGQAPAGPHGPGERVGEIFVTFWFAAAGFFSGALILATHRNRAFPGTPPACDACHQESSAKCALCGAPFCAKHGKTTWCWATDAGDDGISMARRPVCVPCTPSTTRLAWSSTLAGLFMITVLLAVIYGWRNFPR